MKTSVQDEHLHVFILPSSRSIFKTLSSHAFYSFLFYTFYSLYISYLSSFNAKIMQIFSNVNARILQISGKKIQAYRFQTRYFYTNK